MAFPDSPLDLAVELQLAGTWTDITSKVLIDRAPLRITRGRTSEGSRVEPSKCTLTLDNRDGRFSPRNPSGPYYGSIGRNTPLRVRYRGVSPVGLQTGPAITSSASTPHNAALNVGALGDLDVRVELVPFDFWSGAQDLIGKWDPTGSQAAYLLWTDGTGTITLSWTTGGTSGTQVNVWSTVAVPRDNGRRFAVRAVLDTDAGASTSSVTFYWADTIAGPWRQLGDVVVRAGTTSVFASTAGALTLAKATTSGAQIAYTGRTYKAELRVGVGAATLAASPDFTAAAEGAASIVDAQGRTWTPTATASITSSSVRFVGEVSQWPVKWTQSEKDVAVGITAAGILRRLQANVPPLRSTLRRAIPSLSTLRAYWPLEEAAGATTFGSGLPDPGGQYTMGIGPTTTSPTLSSYAGFLCSDELAVFANGAYARGRVKPYTSTNNVQLRFLVAVPSTGQPADGTVLAKLTLTSTTWSILYKTGGGVVLAATNNIDGSALTTTGTLALNLDGKPWMISLELSPSGGNIFWTLEQYQPGALTGFFFNSTTGAATVGAAVAVQVGAPGTNSQVAFGHVTVESSVTNLFALINQFNAWAGETAAARARRLAGEEGYPILRSGPDAASSKMGAQTVATLVDLLHQAEDADEGILGEARALLALAYRPRQGLYAKDAAVTLTYPGNLVDFEPTEDDANIVNDVILTRSFGSSVELVQTAGALSTAAPPAGVGRYQSAQTVNLYLDTQLPDAAAFLLALGVVDEPRYPSIGVQLNRSGFATAPASLELCRAVLDAELGDVVQVNTPPSFYAPFTAYQLLQGTTEELRAGGRVLAVDLNTAPGVIWRNVGRWSDPTGRTRYGAAASSLVAGVTAGATALSVASTDGTLWTTTPAHFPFDVLVAGEVMTVTNITGASSPQAFTVTRAVNGVSKAQLAAAAVQLYPLAYYGL